MNHQYEKLERCLSCVREKTSFTPEVALVLGSGLGDYAEGMKIEATVDYKDIAGFPVSTAPGHVGRFVFGYVGDKKVVCMQGRVHYYEGYDMEDVVLFVFREAQARIMLPKGHPLAAREVCPRILSSSSI